MAIALRHTSRLCGVNSDVSPWNAIIEKSKFVDAITNMDPH